MAAVAVAVYAIEDKENAAPPLAKGDGDLTVAKEGGLKLRPSTARTSAHTPATTAVAPSKISLSPLQVREGIRMATL
jgi:hypothetical protein